MLEVKNSADGVACLGKLHKELLGEIPRDGSPIGNITLRRRLGWSELRYKEVRSDLLAMGLIARGGGRGGAVRRIADAPTVALDPSELFHSETERYEDICETLASSWTEKQQLGPLISCVVRVGGNRRTGGKWTRPDLAAVRLRELQFSPVPAIELMTFEVKNTDELDVSAVYEAVGHRRAAHSAWIISVVNNGYMLPADEWLAVKREAQRHGIGLISVKDPCDFSTWRTSFEAIRHLVDPAEVDAMIAEQFPQEQQDEILSRMKAATNEFLAKSATGAEPDRSN